MTGKKATLQHLQALQAKKPLDIPPACLGAFDVPPQPQLSELESIPATDEQGFELLREKVSTAEFWISLLEGERSNMLEDLEKHRQRCQLALRQVEAKSSALRESEGENRRLQKEVEWLQQSRDQAICERHLLREDNARVTDKSKEDVGSIANRAEAMEIEVQSEREKNRVLEEQLVRTKVRYAETLQKADSMEYLIEHYEGQLRAWNPSFEPTDLATCGQWLRPSQGLDNSELNSNASEDKNEHQEAGLSGGEDNPKSNKGGKFVKTGITKMRQKMFGRRHSTPQDDEAAASATKAVATPRGTNKGFKSPRPTGLGADAETGNAIGRTGTPGSTVAGLGRTQSPPPGPGSPAAPSLQETLPGGASLTTPRPKARWEMRREA